MTKVRLGIIGVGNMGSGHAANILAGKCPEIELTAVADRREARRQWAKDTLPEGTAIFEEGSDLIQSGLCDAVHICTPTTSIPRWPWRLSRPACTSCARSPRASTPRPCGR